VRSLLGVMVSLGAFLWASVEVYAFTGRVGVLTIVGYALSVGIVFFIPILFTPPQSRFRYRVHIGGTVVATAIFGIMGVGLIRIGVICTGILLVAGLALYRPHRHPSTLTLG
jgi:hypothetical protein